MSNYSVDSPNDIFYTVCLKSSVNGVISEWQHGACDRASAWFFRDSENRHKAWTACDWHYIVQDKP